MKRAISTRRGHRRFRRLQGLGNFSTRYARWTPAFQNTVALTRVREGYLSIAFGIATFVAQLPFARLDYDPGHDGWMASIAIALREGATIHREVFSFYGPVTSWVHAALLALHFPPVLTLRVGTCALIALTAALVRDLGRVAPSEWRISSRLSSLAAVLWILLNDAWLGIAILPWSSVVSSTISALSIWLIARAQQSRCKHLLLLSAGGLIGVLPFARINVGLPSVGFLLAVLAGSLAVRKSPRRDVALLSAGSLIGLGFILLLLASKRALGDYWLQSVISAQRLGSRLAEPDWWNSWSMIREIALSNIALIGAISIAIPIASRLTPLKSLFGRIAPFLVLIVIGTFALRERGVEAGLLTRVSDGVRRQVPPDYLEFGLLHLVTTAGFISVISLLCWTFVIILKEKDISHFSLFNILLSGLALANFVQIYPTWDSRHIWWGSPLLIFAGLHQIHSFVPFKNLLIMVTAVILPAVPTTVLTSARHLAETRVAYTGSPITEGLLGLPKNVEIQDNNSRFVRTRLFDTGIFLTGNPDLSVSDNAFRADIWPTLAGAPALLDREDFGAPIISDLTVDELMERVGGTDYFIASRAANLTHLLAPPCIADNCPGVEPNDVCMSWGSCRPRSTPEPLELVPDSSFTPVTPWSDWNVKVNTGFSYPEDDGAWITGHHARLTFDNVPTDTVRVSLYPFLPPEWTHIDISILTDSEATPIRLNDGVTTVDLPIKANTWNELVFRCDTLHRPSELGLGADERLLCAKVVGFEPIP